MLKSKNAPTKGWAMLSDSARRVIERSDPRAEIALILAWDSPVQAELMASAASRAEKREIVRRHFDTAKRPIVECLTKTPGVRLVDPLEGMHTALFSARASVWSALAKVVGSPLNQADITVLADAEISVVR